MSSQPELAIPRRSPSSRAAAGGLGALAILSAAHLVIDAYSSVYAPVLAVLHERLGLSLAQVGGGAMVFGLSASILQPVYGLISDRLRGTWIIVLAPAVAAIGLAAVPLAGSYAALLAALFVAGIGIAAFHPQGAAQAADTMPHRPGATMALFVGAGNLGFAIGPAMFSVTYAIWGWDGLWRIALPGLLTTLLLLPTAPAPVHDPKRPRPGVGRALRARWRPLLLMYLFVVTRGSVQLIFVAFLPVYLLQAGFALGGATAALSIFLTAGSLGSLAGGFLADRVGARNVIRLSMLLALPAFVASFATISPWLRVAWLSVGFFFLLLSNSVTIVLAQSWVPEHRSTVSSLLMGFAWGMGGLFAPLVGRLADLYGLERALFAVGLLPIIGIILALGMPRRHAEPANGC